MRLFSSIAKWFSNLIAKSNFSNASRFWSAETCPHYEAFGEVGCKACIVRSEGRCMSFRKESE